MNITESEITSQVARELRKSRGLTQREFWRAVGVQQSVGARYEQDVSIPHAVRILIVAHYVSGVKINTATPEGVAELSRLGAIQAKQTNVKSVSADARADISKAIKSLETARDALQTI